VRSDESDLLSPGSGSRDLLDSLNGRTKWIAYRGCQGDVI
jgi:hypothetical protein